MKKIEIKEPIKALKRELKGVCHALDKVADRYRHIMALVVTVAPSTTKIDLLEEVDEILARFKPGYRKQVRAFLTGTLELARDGVLTPSLLEKYSADIGALDSNELFKFIRSLKRASFEEALKLATEKKKLSGSKGRDRAPKNRDKGVDTAPLLGYNASIEDIRSMDARELEVLRLELYKKLEAIAVGLQRVPRERLAVVAQIIQELEGVI